VGVTEQRIQFKEVQLEEKAREQSYEHNIVPDTMAPTNDVPSGDDRQVLGRMTGSIPSARNPKKRRKKEKDVSLQEEGKDDAMDTS